MQHACYLLECSCGAVLANCGHSGAIKTVLSQPCRCKVNADPVQKDRAFVLALESYLDDLGQDAVVGFRKTPKGVQVFVYEYKDISALEKAFGSGSSIVNALEQMGWKV